MKYYLQSVRRRGFPKRIRSDKGIEIDLMAECQVMFRRKRKPNLPFFKIYNFGTSTENQRIERWWDLLTTGQTEQWKKLFKNLQSKGFFDKSYYDVIALRFIYMPIIRQHVHTFVEVYNTHRIRWQKNREEYLPIGMFSISTMYMLYNIPI